MKTKQIIFTEAYKAELLDVDVLSPSDNDVTVELDFSAISAGTEKANFIGQRNSVFSSENESASFPRTVGYSSAGTVTAVGDKVAEFKIGDKVVVFGGGHKKLVTISKENVVKIPDGVSSAEASLAYIASFSVAAIRKTRLELGESALVMGLGNLGLLAVMQLRAAGAYPIIAADPLAKRRDLSLKLGADYVFDPLEKDFSKKVRAICGGVNVCIEVTGVADGLIAALDCMKKLGRIALLGCTRNSNFNIDYYSKVHGPGISLIGAHTLARPERESAAGLWTQVDDIKSFLGLILGRRLNVKDMISDFYSPKDAQSVYDRIVRDKEFPVGALFDWSGI